MRRLQALGLAMLLAGSAAAQPAPFVAAEWPTVAGGPEGLRYAPFDQIHAGNLDSLEVAWVYRTGDLAPGRGRFEATPLLVDGTLFISTPFGRVTALDPVTGTERWSYDPRIDLEGDYGDFANRGVATWQDPAAEAGSPCRRRVFVAPIDARLIALDAASGIPCPGFGEGGVVDLNRELVHEPAWLGEYQVTSPPTVVGDLVVVGSAIADNQRVNAPSGVVRAFDAHTGRLRWRWDPVPRTRDDPAYDSWHDDSAPRSGAANAWSIFSADAARDLLFVPVGSAAPDFYGGERPGENRHANSVVALRASTGAVVWSFQAVHHDLWDYDVPAQPVLATVRREGVEIPVVLQATKMGHLFVLHRETGEPVFPVEERPVPPSTVPGEVAWPTQPFPSLPPPLVPARFDTSTIWGRTEEDRTACREQLRGVRSEGIFTPPSLEGTVVLPGNIGGSNWSGLAVDPVRGLVLVPTNNFATLVRLVPREEREAVEMAGRRAGRVGGELSPQRGTPYLMERSFPMAPSGLPCTPPPWSQLAAVDLETGAVRWQVPLGTMPGLEAVAGAEAWGSISLGGALTTKSGLTFVAGTLDGHLYAFSSETGRLLWKRALPAGAHAGPMSYTAGGRQYVVIAAGGHDRLGTKQGDYLVAFAVGDGSAEERAATRAAPGRYEGDLVVGRRIPVRVELAARAEGQLGGTVRGADSALVGELTARPVPGGFSFELPFEYPEEACTGLLSGTLESANGGRLLIGPFTLTGTCADGGEEQGVLSLRR